MFSDIEGSTAMADRLGDKRFMDVLREHNAIIREQVKSHGGFEVKSEGDGFMVAFQWPARPWPVRRRYRKHWPRATTPLTLNRGSGFNPTRAGRGGRLPSSRSASVSACTPAR